MDRPFVIAPTYLRQSDAVGQIERHFFHHLTSMGLQPVVVSSQYELDGKSFNHKVIEFKESSFTRKLDSFFHKFNLKDFAYSPDLHYFALRKRVLREGGQLAKDGKIDYIHTINNPVSSHVMGLELKKMTGLPLIVQLYDPWHNNPFRKYKYSFFEKRDERMEREVAEDADLIIFPNEELLDSWAGYGEDLCKKMCVIPFCTEIPSLKLKIKQKGKLVISHIGALSKERQSIHFINALSILNKHYSAKAKQIVVNYVGGITPEEVSLIESLGLQHLVNLVGRVSEQECLKYYEESDLFLIVDIDCEPNLFYPSKLLKYFCYQKPIMGLTKNDSVVYHELSKTGNYPFKYDDEEALAAFLYKAVTDYDSINANDKAYGNRFSVDSVCKEYIKQINTIQHE